jgi:exonuclease SbcC
VIDLMWITSLELRNIKSHAGSGQIPFALGVNAISGPNGAGKSTILEAIGFALFDSLPYTQSQFLREGEKSGEVVVSFIDVLDEREYQVVRTVGSSSIYIFDPETEAKIVSGKADVVAWLKEHLGVDSSADLTALFEDSIGVPQGLLTAAFLERPAARKSKFDPLLQVDEYEQAWIRLREATRTLNEDNEILNRKIAELTGELKQLPTALQERSTLESEIEINRAEQEKLQAKLDALKEEQAALNAEQKRLQEMERQVETLESRAQVLRVQQQNLQAAVSESERASEEIEAARPAYLRYIQAQEELEQLEQRRLERDRLQKDKLDLDKQVALAAQRLKGVDDSLNEMKTFEKHAQKLEPLAAKQEEVSEDAARLQKRIVGLEAQLTPFSREEQRFERIEIELAELRTALSRSEQLESQLEMTRKELRSLELKLTSLQADRAAARTSLEKTRQHLLTLDESAEADCPVCHQPLDENHRDRLLNDYQASIGELEGQLAELEAQLSETRRSHDEKQDEVEQLEAQLEGLPDVRQVERLETERQKVAADLEEQRKELDELPGLQKELSGIEQVLDELGDPKSEWALLKAKLESRQSLADERAGLKDSLDRLDLELKKLDQELEAYQALDEKIATFQAQRQENEESQRVFLANVSLAEQLEDRRERLEHLTGELDDLQQELEKESESYKLAQQAFDRARFDHVEDEVIDTSRELARLEAIVEGSDKRMQQLEQTISELQDKQGQLQDANEALEHGETAIEALEFIRATIRKAGPFVTRALVQTISLEANRIFGEIMNDHTLRLIWEDDYGITIERSAERREFSQLSGGEKTAAALAVRLALLRELSQIRVAFFDEPTSNLDDQRRENLASQIAGITGFNQLFVISHDDTFERETHHVIHVEKSHGSSQVEVA